jgi:7-cyano-7-deazaguanine synthase in queuosine biosynthesis
MTQKVVVIYSGGMDSFTVLNKALQQGHDVYALSFDYGQRHVKELKVAASVCEKFDVHGHELCVNFCKEYMLFTSCKLSCFELWYDRNHSDQCWWII